MLIATTVLYFCLSLTVARLALWPQPLHVESGRDTAWLDPGLHVTLICGNESQHIDVSDSYSGQLQSSIAQALGGWQTILGFTSRHEQQQQDTAAVSEQQHLREAVHGAVKQIYRSNFVPWKFHSKTSPFEPNRDSIDQSLTVLEIAQTSCPASVFEASTFFAGEEAYELLIENSIARIRTQSTLGTIRALGKSYSVTGRGILGISAAVIDICICPCLSLCSLCWAS